MHTSLHQARMAPCFVSFILSQTLQSTATKPAACTAPAVAKDSPWSLQHTPPHCSKLPPPPLTTSHGGNTLPLLLLLLFLLCTLCFYTARSGRSSSCCALCRQEQGGGMADMPSGGHAGSRELSCTQSQRGPNLAVKHPHGHSCSCHLEIIRAAPSINPSACR